MTEFAETPQYLFGVDTYGRSLKHVADGEIMPKTNRLLVGGKAAGLARLATIPGAPVPPWCCVTVTAYRAFASQPSVRRILTSLSASGEDQWSPEGGLWEKLLDQPVPQAVARQVEDAASALLSNGGPLAVRSSAIEEDLEGASFAGQYDTILDVRSPTEVISAVRKCWASLWTPHAIEYRSQRASTGPEPGMAVVLQLMVQPTVAGVLFTENPMLRQNKEFLINAVNGSGVALVSGTASPEQWRIRRATGEVVQHALEMDGSGRVLTENQLSQLVALGARVHDALGPTDMEFVFEGAKLSVVQARPITALAVRRREALFEAPPGSWTRVGFGEWFQSPMTPLSSTLLLPRLSDEVDRLLEQRLGLRRPAPTWTTVEGYYYVTSKVPRGFRLLAFPYRFGRDLYCADVLWTDDFLPRHLESIAEVTTFDLENASKQEVLAFLRRIVEINGTAWAWIIHSALFAKFSEVLFRAAFRVLGPGGSPVLLLAGYPNKSVEADENLWAIARDAEKYSELSTALGASDPSVALAGLTSESARLWLKRVDGWIADYGHRVYDLDMVRETLQDDRPLVLHLIWKFMNITGPSPLQRQRHAEKVRKDEEQRLAEWAGSRPLRRKLLRASLGIAQRYARIRESRPFYLHLGWPVMRRAALCIGAMLCASGVLDNSSDVFFLSVDQLGVCVDAQSDEPAGEAKVIVREARMLWSRRRFFSPPAYLHPSLLFRLMQHAFTRRHPFDSGVLRGVAGSPGRASGFARVLTDQASWRGFRKGDVLIAEVTTPAWTLLFGIASAVVTEKGGSLSHAAIVAREYGIPAVVGVADLLSRVEDGTSVTVDGDAGTIQVHAAQVHQA